MTFSCSHCESKLEADAKWVGGVVNCPSCGQLTAILRASGSAPAAKIQAKPKGAKPKPLSLAAAKASNKVTPKESEGFGKILIFALLLIVAVAILVFICYECQESPRAILQWVADYIVQYFQPPAPVPSPPPAPTGPG